MVIRSFITAFVCVCVAACGREGGDRSNGSISNEATLFVGVLPDQDPEDLVAMHQPLLDYLEGALEMDLKLVLHESYEELVDAFDRGEVQLAWFGGVTFLQAQERSGAIPIAMRDIDLKNTSVFLVPASPTAESIEDFRGKRMCFGPKLSTAGHLMPRFFLELAGIEADEYFSEVQYAETLDQTARDVRDGKADIGVVSTGIARKMFRREELNKKAVRILMSTPEYVNYVWAARPGLDEGLRERLLDAFLALDPGDAGHKAILDMQNAAGYVPCLRGDFDDLAAIARRKGILAGEPSS